jgi:hypothetical protein
MQKPETRDVVKYILAPLIFLTVALSGGVRIAVDTKDIQFVPPQLSLIIVAAFVMILLVRGGIIDLRESVGSHHGLLENATGAIRLGALYFATAQVLNAVTPERGLLNFFFVVFYFLIFWNNLFVVFNPVRLTKSLATVLGASFLLKYLVLADVFAPTESWAKYILQQLMQTATLGTLDFQVFAPLTGYLAFATVAFYVLGLYLIAPPTDSTDELLYRIFTERNRLTPVERRRLLTAIAESTASPGPIVGRVSADVIEAEVIEQESSVVTSKGNR